MNKSDLLMGGLMGVAVVSAILTLVTYLLFEFWNIGSYLFSILFFGFAMLSAICLMFVLDAIYISPNDSPFGRYLLTYMLETAEKGYLQTPPSRWAIKFSVHHLNKRSTHSLQL